MTDSQRRDEIMREIRKREESMLSMQEMLLRQQVLVIKEIEKNKAMIEKLRSELKAILSK